ncbi:MAG TPA: HEAT repeat domain-containing protein, partial [Kofleriaceae bacterium]|nr:HEAT repeat domain-containing protein [Kofleriaceae bacterium]
LDTAAALDPAGTGVDLARALRDPDPAFRRAAATVVALPAPPATFAALAAAVVEDSDADVALGAAQSLCMSFDPGAPASAKPILDALGDPGLARLRAIVPGRRPDVAAARDAARCLTADGTPASLAAARTIPPAPQANVPAPLPTTSPTASPPAGDDVAEPASPAPKKRRAQRTHRGAAR